MAMSRSCGSVWVTSFSSITSRPPFSASSPAAMRRSVDFPQPDGPTRTTNSPSAIVKLTLATATVPSG